ncbi:Uncharacterised protein [Legionella lansingensis]|uniref:Uncharacterized protein n=2 Tax=Legionella lansingensis TaxID=45067 RepID=A0A0W0VUR3_9GAMM|nr:hypothetical protein [Legionella lansingensis]KTD23775.1 hypothetical protein Llan_0556 [Legionella lansingensis]SNV47370.1 Uncharacterised protein [Legionella lansingensis]
MKVRTTTYEYHHMGIPTDIVREGERYSSTFKMYTSGGKDSEYRIQYHRFEADSPLHPLIKTMPHVAFKVNNLEEAIKGKEVILGPYEPFSGFKVAMIAEGGTPIEFIETTLSEDEIWYGDHKNSVIYPER